MKSRDKKSLLAAVAIFAILVVAIIVIVHSIEKELPEVGAETATEPSDSYGEEEPTLYLYLDGQEYVSYHDIETYLFMGTDHSGNEEGEGEDYRGSMADFLNLLIVDHTAKTYSILALNRETITEIPMMTTDGQVFATIDLQLCAAHWYGGDKTESCENTITAVSDMLGSLPIDGYYAIPMDAISEVNSLVGGVTVTIEEDYMTEVDPAFEQGATLTLTDEQAYNFVHARMGVGDEKNLSRMARQKQYLTAMLATVKGRLSQDADLALQMFDELADYATTDMNGKIISRLGNKAMQYEDKGTYQFEGETRVGQILGDGVDHDEFYLDEGSLVGVMTELFSLEPGEE